MSYPNYVYSIFAFLGFLCVSIPFPWHLEAWNTGTCLYMAWTGLACLNQFINSIVWNGNAINWAPVWCDISAKFIVGTAVAIPAASLCINRRLYHIACVKSVTITKAEKRRAIMVDLAIGLGLPVLEMILQYIPQGHRFNIYEDIGCYPFTYSTPVAFALVSTPPIAIGLVSAVYSILSIRAFNKSRVQFKELLSGNSNLSANRYFRLMCLAGIEVACTVPLGVYAVYLNAAGGAMNPWLGWEDTHRNFSRVDQFPAMLWRLDHNGVLALELSRWLVVVCAFIFFGFFGFAEEARKNYRSAVQTVVKRVGISTGSMTSTLSTSTGSKSKAFSSVNSHNNALPVFVHREVSRKRDSFDSFSDMTTSFADVGGALIDEKEKPFSPDMSFGAMSIADVGGTLADYESGPYSPAPSSGSSSGSSSASTLSSPEHETLPLPEAAILRSEHMIEISSVRHPSVYDPDTLAVPAPTLRVTEAPRHAIDIPSAVRRDSADMV